MTREVDCGGGAEMGGEVLEYVGVAEEGVLTGKWGYSKGGKGKGE